MTITIEVTKCSDCPYLRQNRYAYCSKEFDSDYAAYQAGRIAEYASELQWLFDQCPFKGGAQ